MVICHISDCLHSFFLSDKSQEELQRYLTDNGDSLEVQMKSYMENAYQNMSDHRLTTDSTDHNLTNH